MDLTVFHIAETGIRSLRSVGCFFQCLAGSELLEIRSSQFTHFKNIFQALLAHLALFQTGDCWIAIMRKKQ